MSAFATVIDASFGNVFRAMNIIHFPGTQIPILSIFLGFIFAIGLLKIVGFIVGADISDASRAARISRSSRASRERGGGISRR